MGYENAPATKLVASHCAACGRPLVDAVSVETGMGPDCRQKYGYNIEVPEEARQEANRRVHALACGGTSAETIFNLLCLRTCGFDKLADTLEDRLCAVVIEEVSPELMAISTPYNEAYNEATKTACPWRRWDKQTKRWVFPSAKQTKDALWKVMRRYFAGTIGKGPQGLFAIA